MEVPYLSEGDLRGAASAFLGKHHSSGSRHVPIEEIVEFQLGLDIVPTPGLLHGRGINGYLSADKTTIYVDHYLFDNVETRYLFTLAHEVGHLVLHGHLYPELESEEDWKAFHAELASHTLNSAEYQANSFAGLMLVPEQDLPAAAQECYRRLAGVVRASYPNVENLLATEAFWDQVAREVANTFNVSPQTARIRLENDRLWQRPF